MVDIVNGTVPGINAPEVPFVDNFQHLGDVITAKVQSFGSGGDTMFLGYVIIFFSAMMFLSLIVMLVKARVEDLHG